MSGRSIVWKKEHEESEWWNKIISEIPDDPPPLKRWYEPTNTAWCRYGMKLYVKYRVDKEHKISYIIFNRPSKINVGLPYAAAEACKVARDDPDTNVIVLRAEGRAFCAGYDISPVAEFGMSGRGEEIPEEERKSPAERLALSHREEYKVEFFRSRLWDNPKPIIGAVHGFCLAGACDLLTHADIIYASEDAVFGYPPMRFGTLGTHTFWPWYWGIRKAKELVYTGNLVSAEEAYNFHYVNKVVQREKLEIETDNLAQAMASLPLVQLALSKRGINNYYESIGLRAQQDYGEIMRAICGSWKGVEPGSSAMFRQNNQEKGIAYALKIRDQPFAEVDRWWRDRLAAGHQREQIKADKVKVEDIEKIKEEKKLKGTGAM